jgi:ubiquinol-cytochrome c reductase cytochrome b subunit
MRRQGISGPVRPREGQSAAFYPWQAARDTLVVSLVVAGLVAFAWQGPPALEGPADPTDANYIPRPEWYFLGLFQLLKYFPGKWEVVGAMVVPGAVGVFLALLPWLDRGSERDPRRRRAVMALVLVGFTGVVTLTALGWRDRPRTVSAEAWSLREIGGYSFVQAGGCARCHSETGMADPLEGLPSTRGPEWIAGHVSDPEVIGLGLREPPSVIHERVAAAIVAYVRKSSRQRYPGFDRRTETAGRVFARYCVGCHLLDGDGGKEGPDLSHEGTKHDLPTLRRWIIDPEAVDPDADMPAFGKRLSPEELDAIASYIAGRR